MSQETYIKDQEEEIFVQGGRFYHTEATARRFRQSGGVWRDAEYEGESYRDRYLGQKTYPLYKVTLTWEEIEPSEWVERV
jgi:hypothetical protein